jgi:alpha-glucosidase
MPDKNLSRDPCRTPMQWNAHENAGFSDAKPWLRIDKNYHKVNAEREKHDPYSLLNLYRKLLTLRNKEAALSAGDYRLLHADNQTIAYIRQLNGHDSFAIMLNLSHRPAYLKKGIVPINGVIEVSSSPELEGLRIQDPINLSGDEAIVIRLDSSNFKP